MKIPQNPKERFQYYFDITTGLDEKYQNKIDKITSEQFEYDPKKTTEYEATVRENADKAEYRKRKSDGSYAEFSQGYDNSMQKIASKNISADEERANNEQYNAMYDEKYNEWLEDKKRRIEIAKKRYAKIYGNAYYNMLKANEEITLNQAK